MSSVIFLCSYYFVEFGKINQQKRKKNPVQRGIIRKKAMQNLHCLLFCIIRKKIRKGFGGKIRCSPYLWTIVIFRALPGVIFSFRKVIWKPAGFRDIIFAVLTAAGNITMQSIISLSEGQYHSPPGEYNWGALAYGVRLSGFFFVLFAVLSVCWIARISRALLRNFAAFRTALLRRRAFRAPHSRPFPAPLP